MPEDKMILIDASDYRIKHVHLLNKRKKIPFQQKEDILLLDLTKVAVDEIDTIIVLEIQTPQ